MDIHPQDLSPQLRTQILRAQRFLGGDPVGAALSEAGKENAWDDAFIVTGMAGFAVGMWAELTFRHMESWPDVFLFGIVGAVVGVGASYTKRRKSIRRWIDGSHNKKITKIELSMVSNKEADALKQDYLSVISTLISLPQPQEKATVQNIKNTLCLLGEVIDGLPVPPAEALLLDPNALANEAHMLAAKAEDEIDTVIRASLQRQTATLTRQAETITRTAALVRRNQALRAEVTVQVKAFQTSLAAGQVSGIQNTNDLATLADHVTLIAQETNALAEAHLELETAIAIPAPITEATLPLVMQTGKI